MADDKKQRNLNLPESLAANRLGFTTSSFRHIAHRPLRRPYPIENRQPSCLRGGGATRVPGFPDIWDLNLAGLKL